VNGSHPDEVCVCAAAALIGVEGFEFMDHSLLLDGDCRGNTQTESVKSLTFHRVRVSSAAPAPSRASPPQAGQRTIKPAARVTLKDLFSMILLAVTPISADADMFILPPPGTDLIGEETSTVAQYEDTMPDIARRHGLGYEEILIANPGTDAWLPGDGRAISLPTRHILPLPPFEGLIINLPEHRLYYFPKPSAGRPQQVITHPISVGQMDWETPLGMTRIVSKVRNPTWYPPKTIREQHEKDGSPIPAAVPPGPDNPLGDYAMRLGIPGGAYLIHGTNRPVGVGMQITHGCIRMYPEDIESLFRMAVRPSTSSAVKTGWPATPI
jgi:L,D-transpeptidase ErfK/SrfK